MASSAPAISIPDLNAALEGYYSGVFSSIQTNLPEVLIGAGAIGGVIVVLGMAAKWFGIRRDMYYAIKDGPVHVAHGKDGGISVYQGRGGKLYTSRDYERAGYR